MDAHDHAEGYEEHPSSDEDSHYSVNANTVFFDMNSVPPQTDPLPSPGSGANKLHYLFFNPPSERQEDDGAAHRAKNTDNDNNAPLPARAVDSSRDLPSSAPPSSASTRPVIAPGALGYDLGEFTESGYVGSGSLSGYLNFGNLKPSSEEEEKEHGGSPAAAAPTPSTPEPEENYVEHLPRDNIALSRDSFTPGHDTMLPHLPEPEPPMRPPSSQSMIVANTGAKRSTLEMEDLFAEIVRKTGAVYGRQKLMEFLHRTAQYFGETQLMAAITRAVSVTVPSLLTDEGHMSRTVWNEKFQAALEIKESAEKNERLAALRSDFISTAEFYGRIILAERFLPVYRKSIKPVNLGGVAGGTKYLVHGILYKFAEDVDLGLGRWMYGGHERNDAAAAKACGNELKGLSAVFQACAELDLRVPLMCLVDFSGFRISAQAFLPVGGDTLVYGSRDAGKTILSGKGAPVVVAMMSRLAERLRLEPHYVTDARLEKHVLYGPTDIEVHLGYDGRYYLLDSARLMPPQTPPRSAVRAVFYQLFRSEFLSWYNVPLSPDGYTRFGQTNWRIHNSKLKDATEALITRRIPEFASQLTSRDAKLLTSLMHSWGINNRFLGHVRHRSDDRDVREAALLEMVARTLQKILQERLRDEMSRIRAPQMSPYLHLISDFFNMITSDAWFWKRPKMLKQRLISKFGAVCLSEHERNPRVSLAPMVDMPALLSRLCHLGGIQLRSGPKLMAEDLNEPFVTSDFTIVPRITEMDIASMALAEQYRKQAKRKLGSNKLTLLQSAAEIFSKAAICNPHHLSNRVRWLRVLISILRHQIRTGKRYRDLDLEIEFTRCDKVLADCLKECANVGRVPPEVLFLESSLLRQKYHQFMTADGSAMLVPALEYWTQSYKLLLSAASCSSAIALHIGLNVLNPVRIQHRKNKRWIELIVGLEHLTDLRDVPRAAALLGPIISAEPEFAVYMVGMLRGRERVFGVLFALFRAFPPLLNLLKRWMNSDPTVVVRRLTMEFLEDSVVANYLQLCSDSITAVDLSNCSGITNDALLMLDRMPSLQSISLRRCHRVTDEGVIAISQSFPNLLQLNLSGCIKLTDRSLSRMRCPKLAVLRLKKCVSLEGEFLRSKCFVSLTELDLEECHRITKSNLQRISAELFPALQNLNLNHLGAANGQVVCSILKHCPALSDLSLRNTQVAEKAFRVSGRHAVNLSRLCVQSSEFDDESLVLIATFPCLARLNLKQCLNLSSPGLFQFVRLRPRDCVAMTHLDITDVPGISEEALHTLLCDIPGAPASWKSLKLRGCSLSLVTLQKVLASATNLETLSLAGRPELDLGSCFVVVRSLKKLFLEACSWSTETFKLFLAKSIVSLKLRSCPNLGSDAMHLITAHCPRLEKLHLVALPVDGAGLLALTTLHGVRKLTLHELPLNDDAVLPVLRTMMGKLTCLSLRELQVTDATWTCITTFGSNLKSFKVNHCPFRNHANRLPLLCKLEILHLAAFSTPPFDHGETAADLNQLRVLTLDAAICANAAAFEHLGFSRSLQQLIVLPIVPPQWWHAIADKPIRNSLQSLFITNAPQMALPYLRGLSMLTEINLRESAAKSVFPDVGAVFPLLVFPSRTPMQKSRSNAIALVSSKGRQRSLVRTILNTSSMESEEDSSDNSSPDISMGWAMLTEAHTELQLHVSRLLLETGYKLVLVYRGNKSGCTELLDFAARFPDRVLAVKLQDLFADGGLAVLERRVDCLQLVVSGYCAPVGQQDQDLATCSVDLLRRSMQDIPYSVVNLIQLVLPLVRKGSQKLVVVTTSALGSIADNFTGRLIAVRAATAALNQIVKCFAIEADSWNGAFVLVSPQRSEDSDEESVQITAAKFVKTIGQLTFRDNGTWINTQKQQMNW